MFGESVERWVEWSRAQKPKDEREKRKEKLSTHADDGGQSVRKFYVPDLFLNVVVPETWGQQQGFYKIQVLMA